MNGRVHREIFRRDSLQVSHNTECQDIRGWASATPLSTFDAAVCSQQAFTAHFERFSYTVMKSDASHFCQLCPKLLAYIFGDTPF